MRRWVMTVAAVATAAMMVGLLSAAPASAADWRDRGWYGWLKVSLVGEEPGGCDESMCWQGHGTNREVMYRITGRKARVLTATGTAWSDTSTASCSSHTTWQYLGAGEPVPFGNGFTVDGVGASGYRLSAFPLMAKVLETVNDCTGSRSSYIELPVDGHVGCGGRPAGSGDPSPCQASNRERLVHNVQYVESTSLGSWTTTASWNLAADPDEDPCLTDPICSGGDLSVTVSDSGTGGDLGAVCGDAAFTWRAVTGRKTTVKKGEGACVFLVGNRLSKQLIRTAVEYGVPVGKAFAGTLLREGVARYGNDAATWGAKALTKFVVMRSVAKAIGSAAVRVNQIVLVGKVAGLLAVPLAGRFIYKQIKGNDACIQVIVDKDRSSHRVDWSMVYAHASEKRLTQAKVYRKKAKRFQVDAYTPVRAGMTCAPDGTVTVDGRGAEVFRSSVSTWWRSE